MKKIITLYLILPLLLSFALSCQKSDVPNSCRLTSYDYYDKIGDVHNSDQMTYKNGLLDEYFTFYGLKFTMEYNAHNKLIGSKAFDNETLVYIISFVYKNNKVVEELWLDAVTNEVYDKVFLTYNHKGQLVRNESFILEYATDYTYTATGSLRSWHVVDHGLNFAKAEYTYEDNYKNPFATIKGPDHEFWYTNSAFGIGTGSRWYTSEKVTLYDESNEPYTYYEQDPVQTKWHLGQQNYPVQSEYVDKTTGGKILNDFGYDCSPEKSSHASIINKKIATYNSKLKKNKAYFMLPLKKAIEKTKKLKP